MAQARDAPLDEAMTRTPSGSVVSGARKSGASNLFAPPRWMLVAFALVLLGLVVGRADAAAASETVNQAICRTIEQSARRYRIPARFLTRLIWNESSFRSAVVSRAGAQGIAQFMPQTAAERGLDDPFDPQQAIPKSAQLLESLSKKFGNLGLAAAAYNAGPARVASWLEKTAPLPSETQRYVLRVTGRSAEAWASDLSREPKATSGDSAFHTREPSACLALLASFQASAKNASSSAQTNPFSPWGVQLAGSFSKSAALAEYARRLNEYRSAIRAARPIVIGTRMAGRGFRPFYRVRIPERSRATANLQCRRIQRVGGSCVVLRN